MTNILGVTEMSLSTNQERSVTVMEKKRLVWKVEGSSGESKVVRGGAVDPVELLVELAPMEIRIFVVDLLSHPWCLMPERLGAFGIGRGS
ncbi:unnamed protein product [Ilex paraguariensis]|uniref:Uncharacterized protein n=1 Tax=Ilex paraguariensis TaxID=185542 RepID=A0ABC8S7R4_9AQUA